MSTFNLIGELNQQMSKKDYLDLVNTELKKLVTKLSQRGYKIDEQQGLIGRQVIITSADLELFQYFRDIHFIYWGLSNNKWIYDNFESVYYNSLKQIVTDQYAPLS